jgi:hypothetical protein
MKTTRRALIGAALAVFGAAALAGGPARAQEPPRDLRSTLDLARALAGQGRAASDPLALIVAARLRRDLAMAPRGAAHDLATAPPGAAHGLATAPRGAAHGLATAPPGAAHGDETGLDTPASLLAEARKMARGDARVVSLADDVAATGEKGRERGPLYDSGRLAAGARETYATISFAGGRRAEIYVEAARRVAVTVRDGAGAPICAEDSGGPVAYCWWTPERATTVSVEVVNPTRESNAYRLVTN